MEGIESSMGTTVPGCAQGIITVETALDPQTVKLTPSDFFLLANPSKASMPGKMTLYSPRSVFKACFPTTVCSSWKLKDVKHSVAFLDLFTALAMIPH